SGEIHYGDLNLTNLNELDKSHFRREHIGFIFQDHQLIPSLNVYENIKMGLTFAGLPTNDVDNKINAISKNLNIYDLLKQNIETLSGGEKQRVSIARTLIKDPSVILADEPTGSLDYEQAQEVLKILKEISKNRLVIIVSHDQVLLETYGNEIYTLKDRTLHVDQPKETTSTKAIKINKTKLKNRFLFGYALNNLSIHKLRTFILSLILVISMIGIILSYHFNQSLNNYIEENEQKLVDIFPVEVDQISVTVKDLNPSEDFPKYPNFQYALPSNIQNEYLHLNTLDYGFYTYMQNMPDSLYEQLTYFYDIDLNYIKHTNQYSFFGYNINPLFKSENQIDKEFDTLYENNDSVADYNLTLVLDDYNRIPLTLINSLGLPVNEPLSFESISELTLYYISNDDLYEETNPNLYTQKDLNNLDENLYRSVKISRIIRQKDSYEFFNLNPGIYLNKDDYESLYYENKNSDIVIRQQEINTHILSGLSFQENNPKVRALKTLGYAEFPTSYRIMAKDRTSKLNIIAYIESYSGNTIKIGRAHV